MNEEGGVVGYNHVDMINSLTSPQLVDDDLFVIRELYVCLAGYIFSVDRLVDGQAKSVRDEVLIGSVVLAHASNLVEILNRKVGVSISLMHLLAINREAILDEAQGRNGGRTREQDVMSAFSRGYLFYWIHEVFCQIKNVHVSTGFKEFCMNFIYYMQEGDDLGDWREDFLSGRITPILNRCITRLPCPASLEAVERHMYLSGFYEDEAEDIKAGLLSLVNQIDKVNGINEAEMIRLFINGQVAKLSAVLNNFVEVKKGGCAVEIVDFRH